MKHPRWDAKRKALASLIEQAIRRGVETGEFDDPHPEITALCIPGLIRSIMLYGAKDQLDQEMVTDHITHWVERGVGGSEMSPVGAIRRRISGGPIKKAAKTNGRRGLAAANGRNL